MNEIYKTWSQNNVGTIKCHDQTVTQMTKYQTDITGSNTTFCGLVIWSSTTCKGQPNSLEIPTRAKIALPLTKPYPGVLRIGLEIG